MKTRPVALVTGAGARLGYAFAQHLASQGYDLALHCNSNIQGITKLQAELGAIRTSLHQQDFDKSDDHETLIVRACEAHGRSIDLLINNASVFSDREFSNFKAVDIQRSFAINCFTPLLLSQAFARHCRSGQIINILDARIEHKKPQRFIYSLSKHSLYQATLHCARELAPKIRVNALCPGPVLPPVDGVRSTFERAIAATPMGAKTPVNDLLQALDYLNNCTSVTGEVLHIDSGQHLI